MFRPLSLFDDCKLLFASKFQPLMSGIRLLFPVKRTWFCDAFPLIDKIPKIKSKTLIIHGTHDEISKDTQWWCGWKEFGMRVGGRLDLTRQVEQQILHDAGDNFWLGHSSLSRIFFVFDALSLYGFMWRASKLPNKRYAQVYWAKDRSGLISVPRKDIRVYRHLPGDVILGGVLRGANQSAFQQQLDLKLTTQFPFLFSRIQPRASNLRLLHKRCGASVG